MKLKERTHRFLHDDKLKQKLHVIIFESDTPTGKLFDVVLIGCILVSVLLIIRTFRLCHANRLHDINKSTKKLSIPIIYE